MLAMKLAKVDQPDRAPPNFPADPDAQTSWLQRLTQAVVEYIWPGVPSEEVAAACRQQGQHDQELDKDELLQEIGDSLEEDGCKCGDNTGEPMIRCTNYDCGWFHYSCVNIDEPSEGD